MPKQNNTGQKKSVSCMFCGGPVEVSLKTMSIFCPHCHKRVVCESYTIKSYHAVRNFATCGGIVVEKKGHVVAPIQAESLLVRGLVRGDVQAKSLVEIESTGTIRGNVVAPRLVIRDGGKLIGACKIMGNGTPEAPERSRPADHEAASSSGRTRAAAAPRTPSRRQPKTVRT